MFLDQADHRCLGSIQQLHPKIVRMESFDLVGFEQPVGKVPEVVRDDGPCSAADGCRQDVPVVDVWKFQGTDELLVPRDPALGDGFSHQAPGSHEAFGIEIRPSSSNAVEGLVQDGLGPSHL